MDNKIENIIKLLDKVNAKDVEICDTKDSTPFFEYMIIATALSSRSLNAFCGYLKEEEAKGEFTIKGIEGANSVEWVLADLGDIVVNLFTKEARDKYDLVHLWKKLPRKRAKENE